MKISKYILLFLFIAFCFTDCKKYPEEGNHFRAASKISGRWEVQQFLIGGVDSTIHYWNCVSSASNKLFFDVNFLSSKRGTFSGDCSGGYWDLENKKSMIVFSDDKGGNNGHPGPMRYPPYTNQDHGEWNIIKLTKSEMHLQAIYNNVEYDYFLKK